MKGLKQLLIDLAGDADLQAQYEANPRVVMERYGLSGAEMEAMLEKNIKRLEELSGLDALKSNGHVQAHDYG